MTKSKIPEKATIGMCEILDKTVDKLTDASEVIVTEFRKVIEAGLPLAKTQGCAIIKEIITLGRVQSALSVMTTMVLWTVCIASGIYAFPTIAKTGFLTPVPVLAAALSIISGFYASSRQSVNGLIVPFAAPRVYLIKYLNDLRNKDK